MTLKTFKRIKTNYDLPKEVGVRQQ